MSLEDFQLVDHKSIDTANIKRDYMKVYHEQKSELNDVKQGIDFSFGEKKLSPNR